LVFHSDWYHIILLEVLWFSSVMLGPEIVDWQNLTQWQFSHN